MAVEIVDSNIITENDGDPTALTLSVPSANHVLYAVVVADTATPFTPTITFNGDALSQVSVTTGTGQAMWVGRLINPDVVENGTLTTTAGSATRHLGYVLVSGADTTTPNLTPVLEENGATTTLTGGGGVATDADGIVLSFAAANNAAAITATGTNQSEIEEGAQGSASVLGISQTPGTGGTVTTAWSWTGSNRGTQIVVSVQPADAADPEITSISDATIAHAQTGIVISGSGFSATGNTVLVSPSDDVDDVLAVAQTITAEATDEITFTADLDSFDIGDTLYVFVVNAESASNADGEPVSRAVASATLHFTGSAKFIDEDGNPAASISGMTMYVWRSPRPPTSVGTPDEIITGVATDESGELSQEINPGSLADGDPVFYMLFAADGTDRFSAGEKVPTYA